MGQACLLSIVDLVVAFWCVVDVIGMSLAGLDVTSLCVAFTPKADMVL